MAQVNRHNSRHDEGLNFYIFGDNISHSLSPALHNAGFQEIGFQGRYSIHQSEAVDETVENLISQPNFGGASVTFPHKLQVGRLMDELTAEARGVGAVNTILVRHSTTGRRTLKGDNTDWKGIRACITNSGVEISTSTSAMVLGAGGAARAACYALQSLGIAQVGIVNRTESKAKDMVSHFPNIQSSTYKSLEEASEDARQRPIQVIVACVPADDLVEDAIPRGLFSGSEVGVLVEMAYRPLETGMMKVAARYPGWRIYNGMDVLKRQAFAQFELWTGCDAPISVMDAGMQAELQRRREYQATS